AFRAVPPGDAACDRWTVNASGELLNTSEQRIAIHHDGWRLDEAYVGKFLHGGDEADDRVPRHQAIGIEHDHVLVATAKALHPLGNVASLATNVLRTMAIEHACRVGPIDQRQKRGLLANPDVRIRAVAQDKELEMRELPGFAQRLVDRLEPGH